MSSQDFVLETTECNLETQQSVRRLATMQNVNSSAPSDNLITVLFAAPLVFKDSKQNLRPFPKLDHDRERALICNCVKEASNDIELAFENATHDRLLATIAKRCSCLHYSGHGHKNYLLLEDGSGGPKWFSVADFKKLIEKEDSAPFRFVFVSACYSAPAGNSFASAGVPHVVCCQQDSELKDTAALAFARQFYLALAVGNTVKESFEAGCKAVRATPNLRDAEEEMKKFLLLPVDGNHNVPIFRSRPVREWSSRSLGQETLMVRNLIQDDPCPYPPQFFMGREVEMYSVLKQLMIKRVVSVIGETGIGRSPLVCAVCHYINERKNSFSTHIEKIYFVKVKQYRNHFEKFIKHLKANFVNQGKIVHVDNEDDIGNVIEAIYKGLKTAKALIVFDRMELLEDSEELNDFIRELCLETRNVKILMTNRRPLGIPSLGEHRIVLGPLNFRNTVRLFAHLCHHISTQTERKQFTDKLVTSEDEGELLPGTEIPEETKLKFAMLGRGNPRRIEMAADAIPKDHIILKKDCCNSNLRTANFWQRAQKEAELLLGADNLDVPKSGVSCSMDDKQEGMTVIYNNARLRALPPAANLRRSHRMSVKRVDLSKPTSLRPVRGRNYGISKYNRGMSFASPRSITVAVSSIHRDALLSATTSSKIAKLQFDEPTLTAIENFAAAPISEALNKTPCARDRTFADIAGISIPPKPLTGHEKDRVAQDAVDNRKPEFDDRAVEAIANVVGVPVSKASLPPEDTNRLVDDSVDRLRSSPFNMTGISRRDLQRFEPTDDDVRRVHETAASTPASDAHQATNQVDKKSEETTKASTTCINRKSIIKQATVTNMSSSSKAEDAIGCSEGHPKKERTKKSKVAKISKNTGIKDGTYKVARSATDMAAGETKQSKKERKLGKREKPGLRPAADGKLVPRVVEGDLVVVAAKLDAAGASSVTREAAAQA